VEKLPAATCFLFDNGSFRPDSTLALRRVAKRLSDQVGLPVRPTSLLHSSRVKAADLGGQPAQLLEPALEQFAEKGGESAVLLPLFFGPSGAMRDYLPPRLTALRERFPRCKLQLAACLESPADDSTTLIAQAIKDQIEAGLAVTGYTQPGVILCDHGSPLSAVTEVRDRVGEKLQHISDSTWRGVTAASMERRDGPEYAFNEPLLERALRDHAAAGINEFIVALQFLFPGRHAGPGGDVATICNEFVAEHPAAKFIMTSPIGESSQILALLARRLAEAITP
jgi:sirohydrochlorin ferrochelatase